MKGSAKSDPFHYFGVVPGERKFYQVNASSLPAEGRGSQRQGEKVQNEKKIGEEINELIQSGSTE